MPQLTFPRYAAPRARATAATPAAAPSTTSSGARSASATAAAATPATRASSTSAPPVPERLARDQGGQQARGEQRHHGRGRPGQLAAGQHERCRRPSARSWRRRPPRRRSRRRSCPRLAHAERDDRAEGRRRRSAARAAAPASARWRSGRPPEPRHGRGGCRAGRRAGRGRAPGTSRRARSRPGLRGRSPPSAPATVPADPRGHEDGPAPSSRPRSTRPSRWATAHDSSTASCASAMRRGGRAAQRRRDRDADRQVAQVEQHGGDDRGRDRAARVEHRGDRELRRAGERRERHQIGATMPMPASRARMPNEAPNATTATAIGAAARAPAANEEAELP